MPDRPPFSRFRRLPGLYRIGEVKPPDPHEEPQLLALYLPGRSLDLAERLAMKDGAETVQSYCESLLMRALESEDARDRAAAVEIRNDLMDDVEELASDPDTVAAWNASVREPVPLLSETAESTAAPAWPGQLDGPAESVLHHAGDDPAAFLATLRRGEPVGPSVAEELMAALAQLEAGLRDATGLDRTLAYALHRLAFEGQVLLTDSPSQAAADPATVEALRRVQEAVDRVLSGQDIRYYPDPEGDLPPDLDGTSPVA